jgi:enolase-phosphatase E1
VLPVAAVLTDIEGTTTPSSFVRDVLFRYARDRLPEWLAEHAAEPAVAHELAAVRRLAPLAPALDTLLHWIDLDAKITPLKTIQGMIWRDGYAGGELSSEVYADVAPCLRLWHAAGVRLYAYSPGSAEAQKLVFAHGPAGDLTGLFSGFFDTRVGNKREPDTYSRLAIAMDLPPSEVVFLSDGEEELDAAAAAGLRTCQLVRAADRTPPTDRHAIAPDFFAVARVMALPAPAAMVTGQ